MKPNDRARLTLALRDHVGKIAIDLRAKMRAPGDIRTRAQQLHADEQVAEDFEVWTDLLSRRAAVLWVLKSVYVRVLEDRGLLSPGRLLDHEAQQLFERLAPHLGETAFLRWVYRDLASCHGGLPELFSPQPAEVALPSDELSRALIAFWRHRDADTGAAWSFAEERFEGELMGDLYQELDPIVKDRFALCQTPDFVRAFILDRTLTPAIEIFGAEEVRLLDPACGSGHFLIDGLKRLVAATAAKHPHWDRGKVAAHALDRVVGVDLNDYACALARARLVMTAAELAGVTSLSDAARFHPHVYWADGLEQVERDELKPSLQFSLLENVEEKPRATLTRSDVRGALKNVFAKKFHAVVANPPYIVESDEARKAYHREKVGRSQRYVSAFRQYSLASPFTERCIQLAARDGYIGLITSNNFMKREFGKPLIEKVLAGLDLSLVVDTSQAYIPFHGTPTVLLFGRNRRPETELVPAIMGKRGEKSTPEEPANGQVWRSIEDSACRIGFENEFVSVADISRKTLAKHPWSLGGGGAQQLRERIEAAAVKSLSDLHVDIGRTMHTGLDEAFYVPPHLARRFAPNTLQLIRGEDVRDWHVKSAEFVVTPYDRTTLEPLSEQQLESATLNFLRRNKAALSARTDFGKTLHERSLRWFEWSMFFRYRLAGGLGISFPVVATHNHFALSREPMVFNSKAPLITLSSGATENEYLALLGLLNSSTACFWMKQVFHSKGSQGINEGIRWEKWEQFFEFDATKMRLFPVVASSERALPYARRLDALATQRRKQDARWVVAQTAWSNAGELQRRLGARRAQDERDFLLMVGLQEELDWLCYELYGISNDTELLAADAVEPILPTSLPWTLNLAAADLRSVETSAERATPQRRATGWFARHRWSPLNEVDGGVSVETIKRIHARQRLIERTPALTLIETANFKRRWYKPDYDAEEREALGIWLADRVESVVKDRGRASSLEQLVAALQGDVRVLAVCEALTGRPDFSLSQLVAEALSSDAVPNHRFHVYKPSGLVKCGVWDRTWEEQRRQDAGEDVNAEVPPAYGSGDFLRNEYWQLRGKLDVPKERFIVFSEVPGRFSAETLYGWAGWTSLQRLKAILRIDEELEDSGIPLADRVGLLDSAWRLLPDAAREDAAATIRLKAELQALVGPEGPSRELLEDWRNRFQAPSTRPSRTAAARERAESDNEEADQS